MAIFKKRGRWWIGYRANGKRHREPIGESYTLAKEVLAKRTAEAAERKHFPARVANAVLFSVFADKFWTLHGSRLASKSWRGMLDRIKDQFGSQRIADITPADVQRFYNELAARTSPSTANRSLTLLRLVFNRARLWGDFFGVNPCSGVRREREAAHRLRYLSTDEINSLLSVAHPRLYPLLVASLHTGMRQGELLALAWQNVSLERDMLYILKSKSGKPREIPLTGKLRDVLLSLVPKPEGPVFELPFIMLRRYFDKALKAAAITGFRWHDLRHSFASHFLMRTNDLPALQKLLGHSSPAMTLRYAHLSQGHLVSEMAIFEATLPTGVPLFPLGGHQEGHHPAEDLLPQAQKIVVNSMLASS